LSTSVTTGADTARTAAPETARFSRKSAPRSPEADPRRVSRAIPQGSIKAPRARLFLAALADIPELAVMNAHGRRNIEAVAEALRSAVDHQTMTACPGWQRLMDRTGLSRRTVARCLAQLRRWGLLGIVSTGRSAMFSAITRGGVKINEAAVYVLCIPAPENESGTPSSSLTYVSEESPLHARENRETWPAHGTTRTARQRLTAAGELKSQLPPLRNLSTRHLRSICRDYLKAGWTVADLKHAIDHRPDGSPWPHDGAHGIRNMAGWLKYRLNAWKAADGRVMPSRDGMYRERLAKERQVQATERARIMAEREVPRVDTPAKLEALAAVREALRRPAAWSLKPASAGASA